MIFEHEIPNNSKLYFGKSAKLKRDIENICAKKLQDLGFSEIVTPHFSYHQKEIFNNSGSLIRLNDENNNEVSLRADSTVDVVRIVTKRLKDNEKKWFYIQPIFSYPTKEQYQIGAEIIEGDFLEAAKNTLVLLETLDIKANFQIANIAIADILIKNYGFNLEDLLSIKIEKILNSEYEWIDNLVKINSLDDLKNLDIFPNDIKKELVKIQEVASALNYEDILISPLYYAPMRYYNSLVFKSFSKNFIFATGGIYDIKEVKGAGFALYLDSILAKKL
jgi:histidyl-tRNA synthetase